MNIRDYVLQYTRAQEDTLVVRREVIRWGERVLICGGWILGSFLNWWWLLVLIGLIGTYSLFKTVRGAFKLHEFEDVEYRKWARIDEASLFDNEQLELPIAEDNLESQLKISNKI